MKAKFILLTCFWLICLIVPGSTAQEKKTSHHPMLSNSHETRQNQQASSSQFLHKIPTSFTLKVADISNQAPLLHLQTKKNLVDGLLISEDGLVNNYIPAFKTIKSERINSLSLQVKTKKRIDLELTLKARSGGFEKDIRLRVETKHALEKSKATFELKELK